MVSAASAWEVAMKAAVGTLTVPEGLEQVLRRHEFDELPVTVGDGLARAPCRGTTATRSTACSSPTRRDGGSSS